MLTALEANKCSLKPNSMLQRFLETPTSAQLVKKFIDFYTRTVWMVRGLAAVGHCYAKL